MKKEIEEINKMITEVRKIDIRNNNFNIAIELNMLNKKLASMRKILKKVIDTIQVE